MSESKPPNTSRSAARDAAFRAAYAVRVGKADVADALSPETLGQSFVPDLAAFISRLVHGVATVGGLESRFVTHLSADWALDRLSVTDRILLCMACYELWEEATIPPKVTISEYVKLAKLYGTADSGRFLNGVLASVLKSSPKALWSPIEAAHAEPSSAGTEGDVEAVDAAEAPESEPKSRWVLKSDG